MNTVENVLCKLWINLVLFHSELFIIYVRL